MELVIEALREALKWSFVLIMVIIMFLAFAGIYMLFSFMLPGFLLDLWSRYRANNL